MQNNQVKGLRKLRLEYAAVPVGLIVLWELAAVAQLVDQRFVPAPHRVVQTLYVWIAGDGAGGAGPYVGTWLTAVGASTMRVMVGFLVAALAGTALGLLIGWFRAPRVLFQPLIDLLRPIPITAWVPFTVVIFGIKPAASISLIALGSFFSIALNATAGAVNTPSVLVSAARMLGTTEKKILWKVVFPSALPSIITGLRVGLALAWVLVIVSEMVAVKSGLGFSLWDAYYFGRMDVIIAAMVSVGTLGFISDKLLMVAAKPVERWAPGLS